MPKLINADALIRALDCNPGIRFIRVSDVDGTWINLRDVFRVIDQMPAVNAVEIVRCKDCAHAAPMESTYAIRRFGENAMNCLRCRGDDGYGIYNVSLVYPDDYCSDGVKKALEE